MTDEQRSKINQALLDCNGSQPAAAKLLGMDGEKLRDVLRRNKGLRDRWLPGKAPSAIDVMARENPTLHPGAPVVETPTLLTEEQIEKALAKDNQALRRGMETLGLKGKELETALAIQAFSNRYYAEGLQLIGGGVVVRAIKLMTQAEIIEGRLEGVREAIGKLNGTMPEERELWVKEEATLVRQHLEVSREVRSMAAMGNDHVMKMILLRHRKNHGEFKPAKKPGFQDATEMPTLKEGFLNESNI